MSNTREQPDIGSYAMLRGRDLLKLGAEFRASRAGEIVDHIDCESPDLDKFKDGGLVRCYLNVIDAFTEIIGIVEGEKTDGELKAALEKLDTLLRFCPPMTHNFLGSLKRREAYAIEQLENWLATYESDDAQDQLLHAIWGRQEHGVVEG